jgi:hypothetical protein
VFERDVDIDRLLREERFDELRRLGAHGPRRSRTRPAAGTRGRLLSWLVPARRAQPGAVTIREARPGDRPALRRLAELDERPAPAGAVLVAEVEAEILAALPLDGGTPVADPRRPTAGLVDLLELRGRQLARNARAA